MIQFNLIRLIFMGPMKGELCILMGKTMGIMKMHFVHHVGKYDP